MTPLPKHKHSKGRTHRRRAHDGLQAMNLIECPSCHVKRLPHQACPNCGNYRGREVIEVKAES
ncbi:MAG: 50S ribosomal protein L32 [Anaerolineae bacterium]